MTTLTYSHTLIAGQPEDVNDVQDMFNDVATIVNGNLDTTNLATSAKPVTLLGAYETVADTGGASTFSNAFGTTLYMMSTGTLIATGSAPTGIFGLMIPTVNPWLVSGLTPMLRLVVHTGTNGQGVNISADPTVTLRPIAYAGGAGVLTGTPGATIASIPLLPLGAAGGGTTNVTTDFAVPAAGFYGFCIQSPSQSIGNATIAVSCRVELHHV